MNKVESIKKYGVSVYEKKLQQVRDWNKEHPEKLRAHTREQSRKGGKRYAKARYYEMNGLRHARVLIRVNHRNKWGEYKQIIAPESQIHHEWIPSTSDYRGVALVEKNPHQYGIIDPIVILEGTITLLTEAEIRGNN